MFGNETRTNAICQGNVLFQRRIQSGRQVCAGPSLEEKLSDFFTRFTGDSFLVEEVKEMRCLVEEVFLETPYEVRFIDVCNMIEELEHFV